MIPFTLPSSATVRRALRWLVWPALVVVALNIENLADRAGLRSILPDYAGPIMHSLISIVQSVWVQIPALIIIGAAIHSWWIRWRDREVGANASAPVRPAEAAPDDWLPRLERSVNLLFDDAVASQHVEAIRAALSDLPDMPANEPTTDGRAAAETERLEAYPRRVPWRLSKSEWGFKLDTAYKQWEADADHHLSGEPTPPGLNPFKFRPYYIAIVKRKRIEDFLNRALREAGDQRHNLLTRLREQQRRN